MAENDFQYIDCFLSITFEAPLSPVQLQHIGQLADNFGLDSMLDASGLLIETETEPEPKQMRDYSSTIQFLAQLAAIVRNAQVYAQFAVSKAIGVPIWDSYQIQDGKLLRQRQYVSREALVEVKEVTEKDEISRDAVAHYRGRLCIPNLSDSKVQEIDSFLRRVGLYGHYRDGCFEFEHLGRDTQRWYMGYLLDLTKLIGDTNVEGEVEVSIDLPDETSVYEFFHIKNGKLFRQKGVIQRSEPQHMPIE